MINLKDLHLQKKHFHIEISSTVRGGLYLLVLLGVASLISGFIQGEEKRAWGSLLFNLMFFFSISLGGIAFGHMQDIIGASWGRPIKRLHESFGSFVPIAIGVILTFLFCIKFKILNAHQVYSWIHEPSSISFFQGKNVWLKADFMLIRDVFALLILLYLTSWHKKKTHAADKEVADGNFDKAAEVGEQSRLKLRYWSAPILVTYSILYSLIVFDLLMSLAPTWFSTLWAGWCFSVMMQTLFATTLIFMFALKSHHLGQYIKQQQFHDIGKLMFGFTGFYAYLTYSHVLTYWYTNIPEETSFFLDRLKEPWLPFIIAALFISFLIPFIIMVPKASKWTSFVAIPACCIILVAQWLNFMLIVIPEVTKFDGSSGFFPWLEAGVMLGFLGLFLLSFFRFAKSYPLLSIGDPILPEAYEH